MNRTRIIAVAVLIVGTGSALRVTQAQQTGIKRIDVRRQDPGNAAELATNSSKVVR